MLYIEGFGYNALGGGFAFVAQNPFAFVCNALIVFASLSLAWLFRRRIFFYVVVSMLWLLLGTTNGVILMYRMTPFTTADLQIIDMGLDILPSYLSNTQLALVVCGLGAAAVCFVLVFFLAPRARGGRDRRAWLRILVGVGVAFGVTLSCLQIGVKAGALDAYFENLWDAYKRCGVPYCFLNTWLNKGIDRPAGYSEAAVARIFADGELDAMGYADRPNIVFLQLESFIDPDELTAYEYSGTATPFFKELKDNYSSGHLRVPVVGGGTANTEFEAMSGMSLRYFGPGEYPYKSILRKETCETMAYDLKGIGYKTHAIHNHRGAFYNRNTVFANLGFDDYTSLEYMNYVGKTPKNYAKDDVLQGEIIDAMSLTEEPDYIYCISVQGHGEYPKTALVPDPPVRVLGDVPTETKNAYEYYMAQAFEMDDFLRRLTEELSGFAEPVVLVLYGDHLPALGMQAEDTVSGSTFDTEYVIWSNFGLAEQDQDLAAWQLAAVVQQQIGMCEGTMAAFHQNNAQSPDYMDNLRLLQYDILYGKRYVYGGEAPFMPTSMRMGFRTIRVMETTEVAGEYYIVGEGFTPYSKVSIDGEILDTVFLGPTLLKLDKPVDPGEAGKMKVSQVEKYDAILSTTE
jgi:phosphoglycerol transferase MdoB-like AlkP superfamily enzyme